LEVTEAKSLPVNELHFVVESFGDAVVASEAPHGDDFADPFVAGFALLSWFERLKLSNGLSNSVHNVPSCQAADFSTKFQEALFFGRGLH